MAGEFVHPELIARHIAVHARRPGALEHFVRVFHVPDVFSKSSQLINAYLAERKIAPGGHAGVAETAQVLFLDQQKKWIRPDKLTAAKGQPEPATGINGDPSPATVEMGRIFIDYKAASAVDQIKALMAAK